MKSPRGHAPPGQLSTLVYPPPVPSRTPDNNPRHNPDDATSAVPSGGPAGPHSPHSLITAPTAAVHTPSHSLANPTPPPSSSSYGNVFNPGDTLISRYRIVARLGKGGMGEVYRADDLSLGAAVALKFLPPGYSADPIWVERFRAEVRLTRQISHPNVCRVYDIAEIPATTPSASPRLFLAMEYIDGEDLASLLRRIGRLPQDKAVQISRQICFGLAAAHDQGVIHRDLKPANIMLDGRGNARVTDFGVAALLEHIATPSDSQQTAVIIGTPAYMAPEQLAGRETTKRSDIFALGLVLYELFTGKRATTGSTIDELRTRTGTRPTRPSEHIADLDPAVERVILRCLEFDPADRPPSAIAVAAALPGGDPLAAALAAGETPSPELVARSGEFGAISARAAALTLTCVVLFLGAILYLGNHLGVIARSPTPLPPDALAAKARDLSIALGNTAPPADESFGYSNDLPLQAWLTRRGFVRQRDAALAAGSPSATTFWFRQSPSKLYPLAWFRRAITPGDPPWREPGHVMMTLGARGQLIRYSRVPYDAGFEPLPADTFAPTDPEPLFTGPPAGLETALIAAGFNPSDLTPTRSLRTPPVGADRRFAYVGVLPNIPDAVGPIKCRIEAAALGERLVTFAVMGPWDPIPAAPADGVMGTNLAEMFGGILITIGLISAMAIARLNVRKRRSDMRGAFTLGAALFIAEFLSLILPRHSLADILTFDVIGRPVARALWLSMLTVLLYIALEPIVRKRNPGALVGWARLVTGDWRNPRIGRDLLLGTALATAYSALTLLSTFIAPALGEPARAILRPDPYTLAGSMFIVSHITSPISGAALLTLFCTLMVVGLDYLVRGRAWIVYTLTTILMFLALFAKGVDSLISPSALVGLLGAAGLVFTLVRVGILGAIAYLYIITIALNVPLVASLSTWTAAPGLATLSATAALAAWAAWRASLGFQAAAPQAAKLA